MNSVAIIGGGITGLTAAHRLNAAGVAVTLYEASARVGGVIGTVEEGGFLAENGPNTILETSPAIPELISELGLESQRVYANPAAGNRYILRRSQPVRVPGALHEMVGSRLFSTAAKLRIPLEVFVSRAAREESVAAFVERRLGREFLDYAIDPMIAGIYAGDPARLSVQHAFPRLYETEQNYGSLFLERIFGALKARERRRQGAVSRQSAPKFSFTHGLQTLTDALRVRLGEHVRLQTPVHTIRRSGEGWEVSCGNASARHGAVLLAAPAHRLAEMALEAEPPFPQKTLHPLCKIPYAPISSLALGFRREEVAHPLDGFGVLVPKVERRNILGVIFSSSLFPDRAPQGHILLTCYLGGMRSPDLATDDTGRTVAMALEDLRDMLGVRGHPVFVQHRFFPRAIPQYELGFGRFKTYMSDLEAALPGLYFAGHYRDGISLGDSILAGRDAAGRIATFLGSAKPGGSPAVSCP